jgi:hypothetical protein
MPSPAFVVCFLDDRHSDRVKGNLSVVMMFISLVAEDGEHFFMCVLPFVILFRTVSNSFVHLLTGLFVLLVFNFFSSLYILYMNPLSIAGKNFLQLC